MSKQSDAKTEQGYRTGPHNCGNCKHRTSEKRLPAWMERDNKSAGREVYAFERYATDSSHKCGIGGFAIKKIATCSKWEAV